MNIRAGMAFGAILFFYLNLTVNTAMAQNWSLEESIPPGGRPNPYAISDSQIYEVRKKGQTHALYYPVEKTGIVLPYHPIKNLIEGSSLNPLKKFISKILGVIAPFQSFDEMEEWLGLQTYPRSSIERGPDFFAEQKEYFPDHRMGLTFLETPQGLGFTISCAECHSSSLFGKKILGLTQRFPRANDFFYQGLKALPKVSPRFFAWATEATKGEKELYINLKKIAPFIGAKKPVQLGLDTSLAQVALSLAKRAQDPYASRIPHPPRSTFLSHHIADSKPAVWWNVKYKNRWLSDGSVVSGNPIFTNIIWNEIGRGADLKEIEQWMSQNQETIVELTTAVFSTPAPHITDFFPASQINESLAQKGEVLFNQSCAKCHGVYEKNWSLENAFALSPTERLKTKQVRYPSKTFVVNVGTDPGRWQGMKGLTPLNDLAISKENQIRIEPQEGYVPPPLVGIWARWPYFHNNSAPSLCAVLSKGEDRPVTYWSRAAIDPERDFDFQCNGYPTRQVTYDQPWSHFYDTRKKGLDRMGHDIGIFIKNGKEIFSPEEKRALIAFLQTL